MVGVFALGLALSSLRQAALEAQQYGLLPRRIVAGERAHSPCWMCMGG